MDDKNVTIVIGADVDDPSLANAERDAGESPDPNDTSDPANDEVEDEPQERREVYALPTPIPEPTLEDTNPDGSDKYRNYEEFLSAHGTWVMGETARRVEERQVVTRTHEAIQTRHLAAVTEFKQTHSDFDAAMKSAKPVVAKLKQHLGPDALAIIDTYTLQDADNGVALIHHLAQNHDELKRIAHLPPALQLAALGKLDAVVAGSASNRKLVPAARSSASNRPGLENVVSADDYSAWKKQRDQQERDRRR